MATIKDIAERAGVSFATVSRILSKDESFSAAEETRRKVLEIARELGYVAKSGKKSQPEKGETPFKVGCILGEACKNDVSPESSRGEVAQYFKDMLGDVIQCCRKQNLEVAFASTEQEVREKIDSGQFSFLNVDGILWIMPVNESLYRETSLYVYNHVSLNGETRLMDDVRSEKETAMYHMVQHLYGEGKKRIAFIGGATIGSDDILKSRRVKGYLQAIRENPGQWKEAYLKDCEWNLEKCYELTRELLDMEQPPDAIMCANDNMAFAVFRAIYEKGLRIPEDVAVTGYENMQISQVISPMLTTVDVRMQDVVGNAVRLLAERMEGDGSVNRTVVCQSELCIRGSSRKQTE